MDQPERFFSPEELRALAALPAEIHGEWFFRYWTLKESYIKARGMNLSAPLEAITFRFSTEMTGLAST